MGIVHLFLTALICLLTYSMDSTPFPSQSILKAPRVKDQSADVNLANSNHNAKGAACEVGAYSLHFLLFLVVHKRGNTVATESSFSDRMLRRVKLSGRIACGSYFSSPPKKALCSS
jgi:hypothetical protein